MYLNSYIIFQISLSFDEPCYYRQAASVGFLSWRANTAQSLVHLRKHAR
jgi:hypothetical protein